MTVCSLWSNPGAGSRIPKFLPNDRNTKPDFACVRRLSPLTTPSIAELRATMSDALPGYELSKELGSGHFAKVKLATRQSDGKKVAVKIIKKPSGSKVKLLQTEVDILKKVKHPSCVECYDVFDSDDKLYLVMELCEGGELFDRIVDKGHFTEADAQRTCVKLFDAINYLHSIGIAHRDLKPENLLMTSKNADAEIKITDFGLGKFFDAQSEVMKTPCGTPGYIAPEVLHMKGYGRECDVWSFGVIVYILLCGFPPFYADSDALLFEKIKKGEYEFLRPYWDPISEDAKDLIRKMLIVDPKKRITCAEAMQHKWLKAETAKLEANKVRSSARRPLRAARRRAPPPAPAAERPPATHPLPARSGGDEEAPVDEPKAQGGLHGGDARHDDRGHQDVSSARPAAGLRQ